MKKQANPLKSSLIMGIISNVLNLIMTCVIFTTGYFAAGGIFIIFPISGLVSGFQALKQNGMSPVLIVSFILNAIGTLGALGFIVLLVINKALA